jgi:CBS domain containing-hemolysin-like protein
LPGIYTILAALLPILVIVSALCSAAETALFSLTQADRIRLRKTFPRVNDAVSDLLAQPSSLLVAVLLLNVTVNTAYFTIFGLVAQEWLDGIWSIVAALASVFVMIMFAEVLPKGLAAVHRIAFCRVIAIPVLAWFRLITPVRVLLDSFVVGPLARVVRPSVEPRAALTSDDLSNLVEVAARQGVLHEDEEQLLGDVVQLSTLRVKDIMTPRVDVRTLAATDTSQELLQVARETGYTRFPVSRGPLSERTIVGMVNAHRVLPMLSKQGAAARLPLPTLVEPVRFVPERARVDQLLEVLRVARADVAMVVNEKGEIVGMVQIDNVINELIKFAAAPEGSHAAQVRMIGVGEWEVPGRLSVRDWEEFFEPAMTEAQRGRVSTVAGLILARLGRLPREGDLVEIGNVSLRVEAMATGGRTIDRVRVSLAKQADSKSAANPSSKEATP